MPPEPMAEHRISCHRCGNIRKRKILCSNRSCPHIYCSRCADKMRAEYGTDAFKEGCPVCKELCCCSNKTVNCCRVNHCYRKCPSTKANQKLCCTSSSDDSASQETEENSSKRLSELSSIPICRQSVSSLTVEPTTGKRGASAELSADLEKDTHVSKAAKMHNEWLDRTVNSIASQSRGRDWLYWSPECSAGQAYFARPPPPHSSQALFSHVPMVTAFHPLSVWYNHLSGAGKDSLRGYDAGDYTSSYYSSFHSMWPAQEAAGTQSISESAPSTQKASVAEQHEDSCSAINFLAMVSSYNYTLEQSKLSGDSSVKA